ncbi:zinc-binding alcohol dehydrogenase family protein [Rhizobium paknamense]|uniref:2-desacetyl-2-hydroxyethyl bacteriochlorophyllide A dehydrogenase n=1 Tax=Rhizobium paknamense TaxID=1206817 RepID=A0ABU0IC11_9HYPH|nr:zinc-binding alcohol dehydrogenase family protein [Rhizobium paknamense]MDQ0455726.1 2-desacetyl-2-hydroxyethyl bacteriochlorophyllide A dehydrogenase [Rhizobium paknamense]
MKALLCREPGELALVERPVPERRQDEVLVRIRHVGICGTDFHIYAGNQPFLTYPRVMGHELSGTVEEAPQGSALKRGDPVYIQPYLACGECRACGKGLTNACQRIEVLGVHRDGGMADYLAVPERNVLPTGDIALIDAAMIEFLAIGAHGIRRGAIRQGERVLVTGAGPIGMAAIIFAKARGAVVTVMDTRRDRLTFSLDHLQADEGLLAGPAAEAEIARLTGGDGFDIVIDATGNAAAIEHGFRFLGHGSRYLLLSVVRQDITFSDPEFHKREATLLASRNAQPEDFQEVIRQMQAGKVPTRALNTHQGSLSDGPALFKDWSRPEAGVIKGILEL